MTSQPVPAARWNTVFVRWHFLHAAVVAVVLRLLLSMALAWAQSGNPSPSDGSIHYGADTALLAVALSVCVATFDRRRVGASDLMANLGYSQSVQAVMTAIPAMLLECLINMAVAVR